MSRTPKLSREEYSINPNICPVCNTHMPYEQRNYICCSRSCRGIYTNSERTKLGYTPSETTRAKIAKTLTGRLRDSPNKKPKVCGICNSIFFSSKSIYCSKPCLKQAQSRNGKTNAAKRPRRSKDEIALYDLCASKYPGTTHNVAQFNGWDADIIIDSIKLAVLWNGPWHYREMGHSNHSLSQVQNRDRIKLNEIKSCGYTAFVFEDRFHTPQSAFDEIEKWSIVLESNQSRESV